MKRTLSLILMLVLLVCSSAWSADVKVSALPATTTLTDDDLFMTSTYLTGVYTSKKITVTSLKTVFQPYDATLLALAAQTETEGSIQYYTAAATPAVLAKGTAYQLLNMNSGATAPTWTSTLGATGTRLTKIWATDLEITNAPTINGAAWTTLLQAKDTDLDIFAGITPSTDIQALLASADNATALSNLGSWGVSGSITDEQLVCAETTGGSNLLKSCGAKTTINAAASTLLCKDSDGHVEACGGVTISGTTSPIVNVNPQEVDGHTTSTDLTAAQVSNTIIHNYDQAASDVFLILPTAAAGYSFLLTVTTAQSKHFGVEAGANDKIYLISAAGTVAAGDDGAAVVFVEAQVGQQAACWTFKTGASSYDWACKAIAIGTSTFEAHASSE